MNIEKLWLGFKFPDCEECKQDCQGRLGYNNLCSNLNYLKKYGEKNYMKNKDSFIELKKILGAQTPTIFSFGCGLGLDYVAAQEVFGNDIKYYGIDENKWAIRETSNYKNFQPKLPNTIKFEVGNFLLTGRYENLVICFFNSLFTIAKHTELEQKLFKDLKNKTNFYIVCNYTINSTFHMQQEEQNFLNNLMQNLKQDFQFQTIDILEEKGIIISGKKI
ncbi:MAG: hypothetical protein IJ975_00465 [Clostridia bacterium]|nr:hypothetical protein [Clostridia bacterium]